MSSIGASEPRAAGAARLSFPIDAPLYEQYLYGYPHKLAYGPIEPALTLADIWSSEDKRALSLYVHVPFCEQRCGFCNLFTFANPGDEMPERFVDVLERQMVRTHGALGEATFTHYAIGGGTPTYLTAAQLERMFDALSARMGLRSGAAQGSVETSPLTATPEKLRVLRERGVRRVSIGVQSFVEGETEAIGRRQSTVVVHEALSRIRHQGFPTLNLDLMYGLPDQTEASLLGSLRAALVHNPEELYLYPLYVRPLTLIGKAARAGRDPAWDESRRRLYRAGREMLLSEGYAQVSMRMFRKTGAPGPLTDASYRCQKDGMVGLGPGARSYTDSVHYSTAYAVGAKKVRSILEGYLSASDDVFDLATWGVVLSDAEKRRRFVILSLLSDEGLDCDLYRERFGSEAAQDLPELGALAEVTVPAPLVERSAQRLLLTPSGVERSDQIGPFLMSEQVRSLVSGGPTA